MPPGQTEYNPLVSQRRMATGGLGVSAPPQGDLSESGEGLKVGPHSLPFNPGVVGSNPTRPSRLVETARCTVAIASGADPPVPRGVTRAEE